VFFSRFSKIDRNWPRPSAEQPRRVLAVVSTRFIDRTSSLSFVCAELENGCYFGFIRLFIHAYGLCN
jgi:hypothetical protein